MLGDKSSSVVLPPEVRLQTMTPAPVVDGEEENRESLARMLGEPGLADVWVALAQQLGQVDTAHRATSCAFKGAGHLAFQTLGQEAETRRLVAALKRQIDLLQDLARRLDFRGSGYAAKPAPRLAEDILLATGDE